MDQTISVKTKVMLLGFFDDKANMLRESARKAGFSGPIFVLEDNGFLPDDVTSIYHYFIRDALGVKPEGKARFFNEIEIPEYWSIEGDNNVATIYDMHRERGKIYYSNHDPLQRRLVKQVDWFSERGIRTSSDFYDKYGILYGRMTYDGEGQEFQMTWLSADQHEVLTQNKRTEDIIWNHDGKMKIYRNLTELTVAVLQEYERTNGVSISDVWYNSLSYPFFVSMIWKGQRMDGDCLFWQEAPRDDIPGNMQLIFDHKTETKKIFIQNLESYQRFIAAGMDATIASPLGFVFNYQKENLGRPEALICTNSDQVEHLEDIGKRYPKIHFHVCAITEMSQKLLRLGKLDNMSLYPSVSMTMVQELFQKCDYYLDINHGGQILDAVKTAYLYNQLIVGIEETAHNREYIAPEHIFTDWEKMCEYLDVVFEKHDLAEELATQKKRGMDESVVTYQKLLLFV